MPKIYENIQTPNTNAKESNFIIVSFFTEIKYHIGIFEFKKNTYIKKIK